MSIESIYNKINNITDGGRNTAAEMRAVLSDITEQFSATTVFSGTTDNVPEGSNNLYYTDARVDTKLVDYSLTGHTHNLSELNNDAGFITGATSTANDYVTGSTFNTTTGLLEFTRLSGDTFNVNLDGRYLTGYTPTVNTDDYITSATFNSSTGEVTLTRLSGGTVFYDLDGRYSLTGHTHEMTDIIDGGDLIFNTIQLSGGTGTQGTFSWNVDERTVDLIQNGTTLQLGQELQYNVRNNTGSDIPDGTVVMATGTIGASGRITIAPANTTQARYILGVTTEEILNGNDGKVTTVGKVRGLNTSSYAEGTILYVGSNGVFTDVEPTIGLNMPIGFVLTSHSNVGTIMVRITPIDENHFTDNNKFNAHTGDTSIHFTQGSISITESQISDLQDYALNNALTGHTSDTTIHFTKGDINLSDLGSSAHTHTVSNITDFPTVVSYFTNDLGYITGFTDTNDNIYVTGSTFNTSDGVLTFTNISGGTFNVDLDGRYLTGFTETSNTDDYVSSAAFNTTNGILTLTRLSGGTVTVDLDDRYAFSSGHTHTSSQITDFSDAVTGNTAVLANTAKISYTDATLVANTASGLASHTGDTSIHYLKSSINLSDLGSSGHTHTVSQITDFPTVVSSFTNDVGYITGYTDTNNNDYVTSGAFDSTNGNLTLTRLSGGTVVTNLDNRYSLTGHSHSDYVLNTNFTSHTGDTTIHYTKSSINLSDLGSSAHTHSQYLTGYTDTNIYLTGATVSGTTTKTINLYQSDGSLVQASFTDIANSGGTGSTYTFKPYDSWQSQLFYQTNVVQGPFLGTAISTGTITTAIPVASLDGYNSNGVFIRSSTTAHGGYRFQTSSLIADYFGSVSHKFTCTYKPRTSFANTTVRAGYLDTITSADTVDGAYFEINGSGNVVGKTANNSVRSSGTTAALTLNTAYKFEIDVNALGTSVIFKVTNVITRTIVYYQTLTTNIPTTTTRVFGAGFIATESTTTASDIGILYEMGIGTIEAYDKYTKSAGTTADFDTRYSLTGHTHNISEITGFTDNSTNWNIAYNDSITGMTVTGTTTKTISLFQTDGGLIQANFTDNTGGATGESVTGATFDTGTGDLDLITNSGSTITANLDGRYSLDSEFTSHTGDTTIHYTKSSINLSDLGSSAHTHTISEITDFPTNVSSFTNDAGYLTAYTDTNIYLTGATVTGTTTKSINLFQSDGSLVQASFTDESGSGGGGDSITGATFDILTGNLDLNSTGSTITVNLDDRYLEISAATTIVETLVATGGETQWVLSSTPSSGYSRTLFNENIYLVENVDWSLSGNTITFSGSSSPLISGDVITFYYHDVSAPLSQLIEVLEVKDALSGHTGDTSIHYTKSSINLSDLGSSAHTHTVSEVTDFPTNVSSFTNDSGYVTGFTNGRVSEDSAVSGTTDIDWANYETFVYTLSGATVFSDINLPPSGESKTITVYMTGNFAPTYPSGWSTYINGAYDGLVLNTIVVEYVASSTPFYKVMITQPD